jgi:dihydrodipicolinate synthase/N-acetylneuraminate lyase
MGALVAPRGLVADLITPLKGDGSIDDRGLARLLARTAENTQGVLLASAYAGEGKTLGIERRLELVERALNVIRGRTPVLIWITQDTEEKTEETLLSLKKALETQKYEGEIFWVDTPLYYRSNRGLPDHYRKLGSMVEHPFILHNDPESIGGLGRSLKRENIRTGILKQLSAFENIAGMIFSGPLERGNNYHRACRGQPYFRIYDGDETSFLDHPSMSGAVSLGVNLAPTAWQKITQSSLQLTGDKKNYPDYLQQVWELGQYLRDLKDIYQQGPVAIVKGILSDLGIIKSPACTFPTGDLEEPKRKIKELMTRYGDCPAATY